MRIYMTVEEDFDAFRAFFPKHEVMLLPKEGYRKEVADLLILPGGADVHPSNYGGEIHGNWYNPERDKFELEVLSQVYSGRFKVNKVLGVCRGLQLMNVRFGGNLHYDIPTIFGKAHPMVHSVIWTNSNFFQFLEKVNSLHHQGIRNAGDSVRYSILGYEPETSIIEAIIWADKFLGVQFHPEYWRNPKDKEKMADAISDWALGKILISGRKASIKSSSEKWPFSYSEEGDNF